MIVDAHVHVSAEPVKVADGVHDSAHSQGAVPSIGHYLGVMRSAGVDRAIAVGLSGQDDAVVAMAARDRRSFIGAVGVWPWIASEIAARARYDWLVRRGVLGVRIFDCMPSGGLTPEDSRKWLFALLNSVERQSGIVWIHVPQAQLPIVVDLAAEFRRVRFVINHLGQGPSAAGPRRGQRPRVLVNAHSARWRWLGALSGMPNVYMMLSGMYAYSVERWPYWDMRASVERLVAMFSADRLLWASDFPWAVEESAYLSEVDVLPTLLRGASESTMRKIMGETVLSLFAGQFDMDL